MIFTFLLLSIVMGAKEREVWNSKGMVAMYDASERSNGTLVFSLRDFTLNQLLFFEYIKSYDKAKPNADPECAWARRFTSPSMA